MAIQIPNPGTGNGQTGDNEFALWSKVKSNFENQTHAASRLVGSDEGNIPLIGIDGIASCGYATAAPKAVTNFASITKTGFYQGGGAEGNLNGTVVISPIRYGAIASLRRYNTNYLLGVTRDGVGVLAYTSAGVVAAEYNILSEKSAFLVSKTTADGANLSIDAAGNICRSTSSERYKDIIADLELDDTSYANAMQLAPIVYRSTAEADNPNYHFYSFSAEALGAFDPAFTLWRDTETVTDDEGNATEQPLAERQAEGINLNAIVAFLHATNVKQGKIIADLERRLSALEPTAEV